MTTTSNYSILLVVIRKRKTQIEENRVFSFVSVVLATAANSNRFAYKYKHNLLQKENTKERLFISREMSAWELFGLKGIASRIFICP